MVVYTFQSMAAGLPFEPLDRFSQLSPTTGIAKGELYLSIFQNLLKIKNLLLFWILGVQCYPIQLLTWPKFLLLDIFGSEKHISITIVQVLFQEISKRREVVAWSLGLFRIAKPRKNKEQAFPRRDSNHSPLTWSYLSRALYRLSYRDNLWIK